MVPELDAQTLCDRLNSLPAELESDAVGVRTVVAVKRARLVVKAAIAVL
jgi:hypothetical protein